MIAVIRVRGKVGVRYDVKETMHHLRLTRVNHLVLLKESPAFNGMLQKCKDYATWGEISAVVLASLLEKKGRLPGDKKVSQEKLKEKGFSSFSDFAEKIISGKASVQEAGLKPVFRLHPPKKGYEGIKHAFPLGALGFRGSAMNELILRMV